MTDKRSAPACAIDADAQLDRLIAEAARRRRPAEMAAQRAEVLGIVEAEAARASGQAIDRAGLEASFRKWQLIHGLVRAAPFRDRKGIARSQQWRDALEHVRGLREPELIDWVCLQVEVARNLEKGIQDMRPRKGGPAFLVLLEYVANRKRKALAVLHWALAAERDGRLTATGETLTEELSELHRASPRGDKIV